MSSIPKLDIVNGSFYLTYLGLIASTLITLVVIISPAYIRSGPNRRLVDVLVVENSVNFIAGFFYNYFVKDIESGKLNLDQITTLRYLDWALTTPLLLFAFTLYLDYYTLLQDPTSTYSPRALIPIILLNFVMLGAGYLGETGRINTYTGLVVGFVALVGLLYLLWVNYVKTPEAVPYFIFFAVTWSLYGVAYLLPTVPKNVVYNILDLVYKALFSLWASFQLILSTK